MQSTPVSAGGPDPISDPDHAARNRLVILLLLVSAFTVILNETIMGVALPRLMKDLNVTANAAQWLTTAFLLTMAVVIPITGFLLQRLHTRTVFTMAMGLFSLGTLICALSPGLGMLIFGRVVQACGTAIMMPLLMTTVMTLVPPESRGKTMGNISIVISVAPAIGPTISGIILNLLDWRWMFWLVLPIGLGALALGYARLQNVTEPRKTPLDLLSVPLSVLAFGGLVYGLSTLGEGHGSGGAIPVWLPLAVGFVALALFVARQVRLAPQGRALLDLRTFRVRVFSVAVVMMAFCMMSLFGMIILLPIYMQNVLGMEPLEAGLLLLPGGLAMGLMAPWVGRTFDRIGARRLVIPGAVLVFLGLGSMALLGASSAIWMVLGCHMLLSIGLALLFTPLFTSSLGSLPKELYSYGSAVIGTVQQVAGAAGIALFVSIMSIRIGTEMASGAELVDATAAGVRAGFLTGALISLLMIGASFFVRRPPAVTPTMPGH
ncbi:MDR family MFS transporter [Alloyangia pacifica]|uniref:MFS transporter, DHA2 family, lincomycin resistance protein n=1 Tax=Alloyangia pacifica TaxID=311180 RepID=A0A1I6UNK1_9RHOB|nr:MDR family MFS transporter [Alloyangia pacifica]SDH76605.1 MFS transporter, DHA2 family, lincomycin resistance protein [Alloyangia pacifica]SFT03042.1 MFS transporter, DHA2 family, lincomycin resistance protein [Alloyangia pacifica]